MNYAIVLAGGVGVRMERDDLPKQFIEIDGKPLIIYSLEAAQSNRNIDKICVVCATEWKEDIKSWAKEYNIDKETTFAEAGVDRQQSVHSGLKAINADRKDIVIIMTAVCPFVSQQTINKSFELLETYDACITVVKATDAITLSNDRIHANRTMQKQKMFLQQGPQTYRYGIIKQGHENYENQVYKQEVSEDSELVLEMGIDIAFVMGDRFCIKVTFPEDVAIAEALKDIFDKKERELNI